MGLLDAVKGAIWEDESAVAQAAASPKPAAPGFTRPIPSVNQEMVEAIRKPTLARKTPYTALLEASEKMAGVIADPTQRLKAAYAMIADGRSVDQITKAIDVHIADVDGEKLRFKQAADKVRSSELGALQNKVQSLQTTNSSLEEEVVRLAKRIDEARQSIATNNQTLAQLSSDLSIKESEFAQREAEFDAAATLVRTELENQRRSIQSTLA